MNHRIDADEAKRLLRQSWEKARSLLLDLELWLVNLGHRPKSR